MRALPAKPLRSIAARPARQGPARAAGPSPLAAAATPRMGDPAGFDIVLSSGFLAFAAHAGFLQAVEDVGLPVRGVMGTSSGAITGSLYSAGYSAAEIARELGKVAPIKRVAPSSAPWRGLLTMQPALDELMTLLPPTFDGLKRDFAVGVVGLDGGGHELIDSGALPPAVMASAAVPVLFAPVEVPTAANGPYIDGGVACRIGLDLWRRNRRGGTPAPAVVHLIGRSSPFSGNDSLVTIGANAHVCCSPKSGASLWDLSGYEEQFEEARARALPVLAPLAEAASKSAAATA